VISSFTTHFSNSFLNITLTLFNIFPIFRSTAIENMADKDKENVKSSEYNKDDDNDSDDSSIDFSFLNHFRNQTARQTTARRSVCFADTTKPGVSHDVMDTTESTSEETIEFGSVRELNLDKSDISTASNSKRDDREDDWLRLYLFREAFETERSSCNQDSVNFAPCHVSCVSEKSSIELRFATSTNFIDEESSDDGSDYRCSPSVFVDDGLDEETGTEYINDASIDAYAIKTPRTNQSESSEKKKTRKAIFSILERRESAVVGNGGRHLSKILETRRQSIVSKVKNVEDEDDMLSRRKSRMSRASKAVNRLVVDCNEDDDEEPIVARRKTRISMAGFDVQSMSAIESEEIEKMPLLNELYLITSLAVPSMIIEITTSIPYMITASYVGRNFESIYLVGYSLANSLGNISTNMLLLGVFSTSDTLSPQAFGAKNYSELGLIAIRAFLLAHAVAMPVTIALFIWMTPILIGLGQSIEAAEKATEWFRISAFCLPAVIFIQIIWKFLSAQNILGPMVVTSIFCAVLLTPLMINVFGSSFGYLGTSVSKLFVIICQALILPLYLHYRKPHHPETWTGFNIQNLKLALDREKFIRYFSLCLGGILAR
jgi:MatE